jgi:uncharacterized protein (DUF3820 family)
MIMDATKTPNNAKPLSCEGFNFVMKFGKHKGKTLIQILDEEPSYIIWLSENNVVKIPDDLLTMAYHDTMCPDFEDLHGDWGCRD